MSNVTVHRSKASSDILGLCSALQLRYESTASQQERRRRGQVFTPPSVAQFMAGLFSVAKARMRILDAGAGVGILSAAICDRMLSLRQPRTMEFVLFESDPGVIPLLRECMNRCRSTLRQAGHNMSFEIEPTDFVLANRAAFGEGGLFHSDYRLTDFDAAIMNPPYFKLPLACAQAQALNHVLHGQPNIYALFMATAAAMLRPGGELVALTPRSFCNGLYFRAFRRWFLGRMTLRHIHIFESRTDAFRGAHVLQESVITRFDKRPNATSSVCLTSSHGAVQLDGGNVHEHDYSRIVDTGSGDHVIRIPSDRIDTEIMSAVESWPRNFREHGLEISTGPVVSFRATNYLLGSAAHENAVPLLWPHNVRRFKTIWPVMKNRKPVAFRLCPGSEAMLLPTRNYVLIRRVSAKEEPRRLTASCLFRDEQRWPSKIAIENHVNYVYHSRRELTPTEALGIAGLFNSVLLDRYFRCLSGSTQVNATEIRAMPFPDMKTIIEIGSQLNRDPSRDSESVDRIVLRALGIGGSLRDELAGCAK